MEKVASRKKIPCFFAVLWYSVSMITKGTYKKEEVLNAMKGVGFISQNNKRTIWRKDGVQIIARYLEISFPYWKVEVKKIA